MTQPAQLPKLLIVGAMKAGTTTVFRDLETQPGIFFSFHKEPHNLCHDEVLTEKGLAEYAWLFRHARSGQLIGEASTGYSKLPKILGVPARALRVLGPELKIIYSVREPVARALSHHFHLYLDGSAPADFEEALRQIPDLLDFSQYARQIEPWIETFGREQIYIVQLEKYARDRRAGLVELGKFLGIDPRPELIEDGTAFNAAEDRRKIPSWLTDVWRKLMWSSTYRNKIRPMIPDRIIGRLKKTLLPSAPLPSPPPRPEVIDRLIDSFRDDAERLRKIMGQPQPLWDFNKVRAKYVTAG